MLRTKGYRDLVLGSRALWTKLWGLKIGRFSNGSEMLGENPFPSLFSHICSFSFNFTNVMKLWRNCIDWDFSSTTKFLISIVEFWKNFNRLIDTLFFFSLHKYMQRKWHIVLRASTKQYFQSYIPISINYYWGFWTLPGNVSVSVCPRTIEGALFLFYYCFWHLRVAQIVKSHKFLVFSSQKLMCIPQIQLTHKRERERERIVLYFAQYLIGCIICRRYNELCGLGLSQHSFFFILVFAFRTDSLSPTRAKLGTGR